MRLTRFILFITVTIGLSGCERLHLEYTDVNYAELEMVFDWQKCNQFNPPVSTIVFYKEGDNQPITEYMMGSRKKIKLGEGKYAVLAFNGRPYEFSRLTLEGLNAYSTAKVKMNHASGFGPTGLPLLTNTDSLACASKDQLEITKEMIDQSRLANGSCSGTSSPATFELWIQPRPVSITCYIYIEVDRLYLVRANGVSVILSGIAKSSNLYNRENTQETGAIFTDSKININETKVNGYIVSRCFILGFPGESIDPENKDAPSIVLKEKVQSKSTVRETRNEGRIPNSIVMDVELILKDAEKTVVRRRYDVSTSIIKKVGLLGEITFEINLTEDPENKIIVPNVTPDNEQGLSPGVDDWGDEQIIDIPLIPKK